MTQTGKFRNVLASPLGEEGHEVAKGVQANWIHRGASRPANPVRRHPAKSVCTRVRMIMTLDMDVIAERRHYNTHCPLKGKRLTTFCASLVHPLLSLTHWIFRLLMLPYKSSSLVQNVFAVHRFDRGPPIGSQENDRVSYLCLAPYTLLPLRGISPQGETRDMERKTGRHILHVPFRRFPSLVVVATTLPCGKHVI